MLGPCHHFIVIFFRWSNCFTLIFLFDFVYISIKLFFVFLVLFFLTFLLYSLVLLLFFLLFFNDFVTSYVDRIVAYLRYDSSRMRVNKRTVFYWLGLFFLKLLLFSFDLSFFLCLKLLNSVIKTWGFFHLRHWFIRRYFL